MDYNLTVKWGDTDAAGIVYYPNFYKWMDEASHELFNSIGFPTNSLFKNHIALPIVEAYCEFKKPLEFNMKITVQTFLVHLKEKVFKLQHDFIFDDQIIASGYEVRAWVTSEGERPKAVAIPSEVRNKLKHLIKGE